MEINFKSKKYLIGAILSFSIVTLAIVYSTSSLSKSIENANIQHLKNSAPELFEVNLDLNALGLKKIEFEQLSKIYNSQTCYLTKVFSEDEITKGSALSDKEDFDNDGLDNSIEMILNSDPKSNKTQPNLEDKVQYQDGKSPFNGSLLIKNKLFYVSKAFTQDKGTKIASIINNACNKGQWFFDIYSKDRIYQPTDYLINQTAIDPGFKLFFKKNIEILKNRELDFFLIAFSEDQSLIDQEKTKIDVLLKELNQYTVGVEDNQKFLLMYDLLNKTNQLITEIDDTKKSDILKEINFIIKSLNTF